MSKTELRETQIESIEICKNVTTDYKNGEAQLWQWVEVTRRALLDFWAVVAEYQRTK